MTQDTLATGVRLGTVLILEDEGILSMLMEDIVRNMGAEVVEVFGDSSSALDVARTASIDCAILDIVVRDGTSHQIADILGERGIPFVFSTGSDIEGVPDHHRHRPIVTKPFADEELRAGIAAAVAAAPHKRSLRLAPLPSTE